MSTNSITKYAFLNVKKHHFFLIITLMVVALLSFILEKHAAALESMNLVVNSHTYAFLFLRWAIIFLVFVLWPFIVTFMGKKSNATQDQIMQMKNERVRILVWLMLFEVLVCENLIFKLIHSL